MGVSHRHLNCTMSHQLRDSPNIHSRHHQPRGERVPVALATLAPAVATFLRTFRVLMATPQL